MQERWDVVLRVLNGPMSAMGDQTLRGPVVRIGANPGPGGFKLNGYRGLDARHAVITAYDKATASIAPVGTAQVRMAPHPNVRWQDIDPMSGPNYLSQGCALHLGPVGRGCTLEFVRIQRLGVWQQGQLLSAHEEAVQDVASAGAGVVQGAGAPPAAYQARRVTRINASTVPIWFGGGLLLMAAIAMSCIGVFVAVRAVRVQPLGPEIDGDAFYPYAAISTAEIDPRLRDGLRSGFHDFVTEPSGAVAPPAVRGRVNDPDQWDQRFYDHVAASVQTHLKAFNVFRRMDQVRDSYAEVVTAMRAARLPEVFAGIPYLESRYDPEATSVVCAAGYWQFMPEVAHRLTEQHRVALSVRGCRFSDADSSFRWSPTLLAPPPANRRDYVDQSTGTPRCRITTCDVDQRRVLGPSTDGAVIALGEAWDDADFRESGAAVAITIASHNAGYDDSRFRGRRDGRPTNMKGHYLGWRAGKPREQWHRFYGENITTATPEGGYEARNGSMLAPETQHYVYTIVAEHLLAVCYYALNYGDDPAFTAWVKYTRSGGYCRELDIPTRDEVRR
jgi:hypothetical protein